MSSRVQNLVLSLMILVGGMSASATAQERIGSTWPQWRGPTRDGVAHGTPWPETLSDESLRKEWRVELPLSYSGPIVTESMVFVTGTVKKTNEVVLALDRKTGRELWKAEWPGSLTVPFFAAANGSWIRATPACDGESLYVAGMRDLLVSLNTADGKEQWRMDFAKEFKSPLPAFGFVSSPLVDGEALYVQAGASCFKLNKRTGQAIWRILKDDGGMSGSAFSSPVLATLAGTKQVLFQTREKLAGVDPETGKVLWERSVPSFRGMNILTPVVVGDSIFTSTYQNKSWLFQISEPGGKFQIQETWSNNAQGYMSTPVVIDGHVYLHLQNQRFTCIDLTTGQRTWTSEPFGKYCSLVCQKDRILALDERGKLLLLQANPKKFELLAEVKVSDQECWAHLAVCDEEIFVRELKGQSVFRWSSSTGK